MQVRFIAKDIVFKYVIEGLLQICLRLIDGHTNNYSLTSELLGDPSVLQ